jgi:hypothetical protein
VRARIDQSVKRRPAALLSIQPDLDARWLGREVERYHGATAHSVGALDIPQQDGGPDRQHND